MSRQARQVLWLAHIQLTFMKYLRLLSLMFKNFIPSKQVKFMLFKTLNICIIVSFVVKNVINVVHS